MQMVSIRPIFAAAAAAVMLTAGIARAGEQGVDITEPVFTVPVVPSTVGAAGVAPGTPQAIAVTLNVANTFAVQAVAQGVPALTPTQRATALARLAEVIAATGGSAELSALVTAVNAAPVAQ